MQWQQGAELRNSWKQNLGHSFRTTSLLVLSDFPHNREHGYKRLPRLASPYFTIYKRETDICSVWFQILTPPRELASRGQKSTALFPIISTLPDRWHSLNKHVKWWVWGNGDGLVKDGPWIGVKSWEVIPWTQPGFRRRWRAPKHCSVVKNVNSRLRLPRFEPHLHLCDCAQVIPTFKASAAPSRKAENILTHNL